MKLTIGSDIGNYVFTPSTKILRFTDLPFFIKLHNVLSIFNVTTNTMIYLFSKSGYGATLSADNKLLLDYDTTSMSEDDELLIIIDVPEFYIVTDVVDAIKKLTNIITPLAATADRSNNRTKGTVILESGTVTTCTTCGTCTTLANIGNFPGNTLGFIASNNAWANSVGRRFT